MNTSSERRQRQAEMPAILSRTFLKFWQNAVVVAIVLLFVTFMYMNTFRWPDVSSSGMSSLARPQTSPATPTTPSTGISDTETRHDDLSPQYEKPLDMILLDAAMPDMPTNFKVLVTTLNAAWTEGNYSMFDLLLDSFRNGEGTQKLIKHLVIVCLDQKAYDRCMQINPHLNCFKLMTEGVDFSGEQALLSTDYIKMIWKRIEFLIHLLERSYSFIFTDADILWFRDPIPLLEMDSEADFQMACDRYNGKPADVNNIVNAGFVYTRANEKTLQFYKYWYRERSRDPRMADQEVFNVIKHEDEFRKIGMKIRFLDTQYIGGFCALRSTDMTKAYTMHATCCLGRDNKFGDLRMMLDGWKKWKQLEHYNTSSNVNHFPNLKLCPKSWPKHAGKQKQKLIQPVKQY